MRICIERDLARRILIFNILAILTFLMLIIESNLLSLNINTLNIPVVIAILSFVTLFIALKKCSEG